MITRLRIRLSGSRQIYPQKVLQICCLLCFTVISAVNGQVSDLRMQYFTIDQGLYSVNIHDVVQDSTGFIWVASHNGLFRYDAYGFKGYYPVDSDSTSLSSSRINCLFVDSADILWIGTEAGLQRYVPSGDQFSRVPLYSIHSGTVTPPIRQIEVDHRGNMLIGTDHEVLVSGAGKNDFKLLINHEQGQISCILPDADHSIWIGCAESCGLTRYNNQGQIIELVASPADLEFLSGLRVTDLAQHGNEIWISALRAGTVIYNPGSGAMIRVPGNTWDENMVVAIHPDRVGNIWTIDYGGIKIRRNNGEIVQMYYTDPDDPEAIRSGVSGVFEDNQGNFWVYHNSNGLGISVKRKGFNRMDAFTRKSLSTKGLKVNCIQEDRSGNLWIGLTDGGIRVYNLQELTTEDFHYNQMDPYSLGRGAVMTLYRDSHGTMWIGTFFDGLQYYQESTKRFISFRHDPEDPNSIAGNDVRSIAEDGEGNLWLAVHGKGIDRFNPRTREFTHFNNDNSGLSNNWTFQLLVDPEGGIWAGTAWGLNYMGKGSGKFESYIKVDEDPGSLSDNHSTTIHLDRDGTLWVGTQNGLNRFHPEEGTFSRYLTSGRYSYISGILSDEALNLWVSHRSGLLRFDPESERLTNFGLQDGLQSDRYNERSFYKSRTGEFFFGGDNGIDRFRPSELISNMTPPGVVIDQIRIVDRDARIDSSGTPVSILLNPSGTLKLKPSQFMFTLSFKALNFINPENNHYMTMLDGLDLEWSDLGTNREVSYTNLDAGTYTFRVRGSNNDGVWSRDEATLNIVVMPVWYKTWLFRIILILVVFGGVYLVFAIRTSTLRARAHLLDQLVREKPGSYRKRPGNWRSRTANLRNPTIPRTN
jgi:ligand-binding sensor domain-containing protein